MLYSFYFPRNVMYYKYAKKLFSKGLNIDFFFWITKNTEMRVDQTILHKLFSYFLSKTFDRYTFVGKSQNYS